MSLENIDPTEDLTISPIKFEYLDHTADVQIHSWGVNLKEAFEQCAIGMFGYITDLKTVSIQHAVTIEVEGEDLKNLLFKFLDELLFVFCAEPFLVCKKVNILEFDTTNFKIKLKCYGEVFDLNKHPQGTEVKAITYSNMQIHDNEDKVDIYVIIDI